MRRVQSPDRRAGFLKGQGAMIPRAEHIPLSPCGRGVRGEGSARQRLGAERVPRDPSSVGFADTFSRKGRRNSAPLAPSAQTGTS
jgi:hypothetical protein